MYAITQNPVRIQSKVLPGSCLRHAGSIGQPCKGKIVILIENREAGRLKNLI